MKLPTAAMFLLTMACALMSPGCTTDGPYFGKTTPPSEQRLVFENTGEPETLDPTKTTYSNEISILPALFEGLVQYHPETLEPMAALATHYEKSAGGTRFTFYLRGHPRPQGIKLPNTDTLREEFLADKVKEDFARGKSAPPDNIPARWSDGTVITAHDFVYSWRRAADPETASPLAFYLFPVRNAQQINTGKLRPESLGVRALDDFTFQFDLKAPAPFVLKLLCTIEFTAVPRQAIELARQRGLESSWTQPGNIVTSGPFRLGEWRPYDRLVIQKSQTYYEAELLRLREIVFISVADGMTNINIYKVGQADMMDSIILPPMLLSLLRRKDDLHIDSPLNCRFYSMNIKRPPFDNALLRYALNMAIYKKPIAEFLGVGQFVASSLVTPMGDYQPPERLNVPVDGQVYDVLSYSPEAARVLLAKAGFPGGFGRDGRRLTFELKFPMRPRSLGSGEILQRQWRESLNIDVKLAGVEQKVWVRTLTDRDYNGVVEDTSFADYLDANAFLEVFVTDSGSASGFSDPGFDTLLAAANSTVEPGARTRKLQECELFSLKAMPIVPLCFDAQYYLMKPYVRGVGPYRVGSRLFKYAWIDTNWRPEGKT